MKFKVGDRVVVKELTKQSLRVKAEYVGRSFKVVCAMDGLYPYSVEPSTGFQFSDEELEFEEIYNSPLYQALK